VQLECATSHAASAPLSIIPSSARFTTPPRSATTSESVARTIAALKFEHRTRFDDFAVLYRGNHQARAFEQAARIEKYEPRYWLHLGKAYVRLGRESDAKVLNPGTASTM
jgi:hypothetical protein